jgi:phosphopantetheinyl transferase (holo-ACP synthase)
MIFYKNSNVDKTQVGVKKLISKELKTHLKKQAQMARQTQKLQKDLALKEAAVKPLLEQAKEANLQQEMENYKNRRELQNVQKQVYLLLFTDTSSFYYFYELSIQTKSDTSSYSLLFHLDCLSH